MTLPSKPGPAASIESALRQIDDWIGPDGVAGAGAAVWRQGELVAERYAGEGQPGVPVDESTIFALASVTKPVAAAVLLCLVDDGLLGLDEPAGRFLPEFLDADDAGEYGQFRTEVTVRHLLCHTSGLPEDLTAQQIPMSAKPTLDDMIDAMCRLPLLEEPGTELRYSNPGYGMLARIVHRIS
ncbi:MAG: serine hydrolase domain-containing protein, partial [Thermomicrobiales bacterium]